MRGDRIADAARRLMRHETFTLIVSPAIADLQRARLAGASTSTMARLWLGVARAASGALLVDLVGDLRGAMRLSIHGADRWSAFTAFGVAAIVLLTYYPRLGDASPSTQLQLLLWLLPSAAAAGVLFGLVPLGRAFARRPTCSWREMGAAAALLPGPASPLREWLPAAALYAIALTALALAAPAAPHRTQAA